MKVHIIGAGISGLTVANKLSGITKDIFIYDSREHVGGNCYSYIDEKTNIEVHKYGPHIFHTSNDVVKSFLNGLDIKFNNYIHKVKVYNNLSYYSFPYNKLTHNQIYDGINNCFVVKEPTSAKNFEDYLIQKIGKRAYSILYKYYTRKQWGVSGDELPVEIAKRIPIRNNFIDDYFDDDLQGIPIGGYSKIFESLLKNINKENIILNKKIDFNFIKQKLKEGDICVYTGSLDDLIILQNKLQYRSLDFVFKTVDISKTIGCAQLNFADIGTVTRVTDFLYFDYNKNKNSKKTILCYEFPKECILSDEKYYPINNIKNDKVYEEYLKTLYDNNKLYNSDNLFLCGRLADYKYYNMDMAMYKAILLAEKIQEKIKWS